MTIKLSTKPLLRMSMLGFGFMAALAPLCQAQLEIDPDQFEGTDPCALAGARKAWCPRIILDGRDAPACPRPADLPLLPISFHNSSSATIGTRAARDANVIEFYVPVRFRKAVKWMPQQQRGRVLEFPVAQKRTA